MSLVNSVLKALEKGDNVRDYKHASRTFVDNNFELQPRHGHLFHVVFTFTPEAATIFDNVDKLEMPLLVKSADLPTFAIDVETHNQYNRTVHSQHKIRYNPVNIVFHDDQKDLIRTMWYRYMTFYYQDSRYVQGGGSYSTDDRYGNYNAQSWGFQNGAPRFFKDIKIYSMHQKRFAEYTLINPIINSFNHSQHSYADSNFMEHTMNLNYETVKYATGFVNNINPRGFGDIHYDTTPSPIGVFGRGPGNSILFGGGLVDAANQVVTDLESGNIIGAVVKGGLIFNNTKNAKLKDVLFKDLQRAAGKILRGENPLSGIVIPRIPSALTDPQTSSANITTQNITSNPNSGVSDPGIVRSNNASTFNNTWFNPDTGQRVLVGNANTTIKQGSSPANPRKLSDIEINTRSSAGVTTRSQKLVEIKTRVRDIENQIQADTTGNTIFLERERQALLERYKLESGKTIEV